MIDCYSILHIIMHPSTHSYPCASIFWGSQQLGHDNAQLTQSTIPLPSLVSPAILSHFQKNVVTLYRATCHPLESQRSSKNRIIALCCWMFTFKKTNFNMMVDSIENLMGWLCYERQINKGKIQSSNTNKIDAEQVLLQI